MDPQSSQIQPQGYTQPPFNPKNFYPIIYIERNVNPNRLWAFPFLGGLVKLIILIPQAFFIIFLLLATIVYGWINVLRIMVNGNIWPPYYLMVVKFLTVYTKVQLFFYGITDKYPGFNAKTFEGFDISIEIPKTSKRFFALPLLGFAVRLILLTPFSGLMNYVGMGSLFLTQFGSLPVLIKKYYPETTHELVIDNIRMSLAHIIYLTGLSDDYPSFRISENNLGRKVFFMVGLFFTQIILYLLVVSLVFLRPNPSHTLYKQDFDYKANTEFTIPSTR